MKATKCRSILSSAEGAAVSPSAAAEACAVARSGEVSSSSARGAGLKGVAWVINSARGVDGAANEVSAWIQR